MTDLPGGRSRARLGTAAVRDLHPASFAFVMATGIISTDAFLLGPSWLSRTLLAAACAGLVILVAALILRLAILRAGIAADLMVPGRAFSLFAIVAALDVTGIRLDGAGHPLATAILAGLAAAVWLVLTYGVPATLLLAHAQDSVLGEVDGTWLLWVVGTQSLSVAAAGLAPAWLSQSALLAAAAVGLWGVGVVLYLLLACLILVRWLTVPVTAGRLGPPYWILMGAAAISVLAGAGGLGLRGTFPAVKATAGFVSGFSFALWAFATWWIPLLVIFSLWRHVRPRWPPRYEPSLWSLVFPLGMYSAATLAYGRAVHLGFMGPLSRLMMWVAVAAWAAVAVAFLARLTRARGPAQNPES